MVLISISWLWCCKMHTIKLCTGGNWEKDTIDLWVVSYNYMWIYNYLNIKVFQTNKHYHIIHILNLMEITLRLLRNPQWNTHICWSPTKLILNKNYDRMCDMFFILFVHPKCPLINVNFTNEINKMYILKKNSINRNIYWKKWNSTHCKNIF